MSPVTKQSKKLPAIVLSRIKKKGVVFVVSGPSGCGKTTLCEKLLKQGLGLVDSVSATTRSPRKDEKRNSDYIFLTDNIYKISVKSGVLKKLHHNMKIFHKY